MKKNFSPDRGDVIWLNFAPQAGHEQGGKRPALVLSAGSYNRKTGLAVCCPITRQIKGYPFEVVFPNQCKTEGAVLSDHVKSLDWRARSASFIEKAPAGLVTAVIQKLTCVLEG